MYTLIICSIPLHVCVVLELHSLLIESAYNANILRDHLEIYDIHVMLQEI